MSYRYKPIFTFLTKLFVDGNKLASSCLTFLNSYHLPGSPKMQYVINYVFKKLDFEQYIGKTLLCLHIFKGVFSKGVSFFEDMLLTLKADTRLPMRRTNFNDFIMDVLVFKLCVIVVFFLDEKGDGLSVYFIRLDDLLWFLRLLPEHPQARVDSAGVFLGADCATERKVSRESLEQLWSAKVSYSAGNSKLIKQYRTVPDPAPHVVIWKDKPTIWDEIHFY